MLKKTLLLGFLIGKQLQIISDKTINYSEYENKISYRTFYFWKKGDKIKYLERRNRLLYTFNYKKKNKSFGKVKAGPVSFYFDDKSKKYNDPIESYNTPKKLEIKKTHKQAYEPWTKNVDMKLVTLFRQGKTVEELRLTFGRTKGAIRSRINKLLLQ